MATQTIQFRSPPSQTVTLRLFVAGSDTQIASSSATEATNRKGTYTADFTDVPAAEYQYIATIGTSPIIPVASGYVSLTLTTATFQTYDAAKAVNLSEVPAPDAGAIATAVAQYDQRTEEATPGSIGWLFKKVRQSNQAIEFTVTNDITPTTTTFSINLTSYDTSAFAHSVLLMLTGTAAEDNGVILSYTNNGTYATILLEKPMANAPSVGDEGLIRADSHVHSVAEIAAGVWGALTSGYDAATGTFGRVLYAISTMIENVSGWRWTAASLSQAPTESGIGEHQITLVADSTGGQVPGVVFRIVDTVLNVTTGSDGEAIINLDAGTYTLRTVAPPGYESVADQSLVVTDDATVTTTLTAIPVVPSVIQGAPSASLALRPAMDRKTPLLTLASVVDHLLLLDEINPAEPRAVERASKAAKDALSSFASYSHQGFRYYESRAKIIMPGTVSLGTITVSNGSFTMAGDFTIPSWATLGHVRIDRNANKVYPVLLVNGQVITVDNAIEDGTYSNVYLEQLFYPLPRNFRRRGTLSDGKNNYPVEDMSGGSFQSFQDYYRWIGFSEFDRRFSAITMDQRNQGDLMLSVWPPFSDRVELSMFFERYPEALKHHRVGNSSATLSVSGSTATSTHAIFNENHVGAALTVGINSDQELLKSLASESLVDTQRIIRYVSSSTQVILDTPFSSPVSSRSFYISDIVDVQPGIMTEAYKRLAEYELLRQTKGSKADKKLQEFVAALQMAQSDDARYKQSVDPFASPVGGVQWGEVRGRP